MAEALPLLFHLWQAHQVAIERNLLVRGEQIVVAAHITNDSAPSQTIIQLFNQFLGTAYNLTDIMREERIERVSERCTLAIVVKLLWVLDLGDETLPIYEADEEIADFTASLLEQSKYKRRHSFQQYPNGTEQYPGSVIVFSYNTERPLNSSEHRVFGKGFV
ncbi:MAG: hypothetical protein JO202_07515 [Ktedonobacteraceae bacterium]|nr:hypothetical protein [Ktedonobacteraceae bacterium]